MPFELKVIAEPKSKTQCGGCPGGAHSSDESPICVFFGHTELEWKWRSLNPPKGGYYARLPECVEAERRAKEGQSEAVRARCAECRDLCSECSD